MTEHLITIKPMTPSRNEVDKWHWGKRNRFREALELEVFAYLTPKLRQAFPLDPRNVIRITRYSPGTLDDANMIGGCKQLVDALVRCGVIEDDADDKCTIEYEQQRCPKGKGRTEITINI